jgi:hypothetical protein
MDGRVERVRRQLPTPQPNYDPAVVARAESYVPRPDERIAVDSVGARAHRHLRNLFINHATTRKRYNRAALAALSSVEQTLS